ncbi:MAG: energy transducer TonB [Candidatus Saccharicenans sp.]|jgi:TonB family protein|nr:energy transducer TonB [Candidatus Saccharicenans sp.]MDH7492723.1 energy transducer TonB [Candidatus Saccharicenans sp.]
MKNLKMLPAAGLVIIVLLFSLSLVAQTQKVEKSRAPLAEMKLKVFEGIREGRVEPVKTVTSSFLRYTLSASIKSEDTSEKEENQLRRVFNLKGVRLLTEANLSWPEIRAKDFHLFRLDSKEYGIVVTLVRVNSQERITCRVEVLEQDKDQKSSLVDSELALDKNVVTTFGFEDSSGKPYFLSLKVQKIWGSPGIFVPLEAVEAVPPGAKAGEVIPAIPAEPWPPKDAVRAMGDIAPPKIIKKVEPVYPEEARRAGVEGIVILEVTTDKFGRVAAVRVLRSVPPLDQAAIEAVKQWVYEPVIIDGEPRPIIFTVNVTFKLK